MRKQQRFPARSGLSRAVVPTLVGISDVLVNQTRVMRSLVEDAPRYIHGVAHTFRGAAGLVAS